MADLGKTTIRSTQDAISADDISAALYLHGGLAIQKTVYVKKDFHTLGAMTVGDAVSQGIGIVNAEVDIQVGGVSVVKQTDTIGDSQVPQSAVTQHEAALSITENQITDLQSYALVGHTHVFSELTDSISSSQVPAMAVTQHQNALEITESQITDFGNYSSVGHNHVFSDITDTIGDSQVPESAITQHATSLTWLNLGIDKTDISATDVGLGDIDGRVTTNENDIAAIQDSAGQAQAERTITGTTHTIEPADAGAVLLCTSDSPVTITVETNETQTLPARVGITILQIGDGVVTIDSASGVTLSGNVNTKEKNSALSLYQREELDHWQVIGGVE